MCGLGPLADADPQDFFGPRKMTGLTADLLYTINYGSGRTRVLFLDKYFLITSQIFNFETVNNFDFVSSL